MITLFRVGAEVLQGRSEPFAIKMFQWLQSFVRDHNDRAAQTGTIRLFAFNTPPQGWLKCDGSTTSRTSNAELFALVGVSFGAGDGSTTFGLPNIAAPLDCVYAVKT